MLDYRMIILTRLKDCKDNGLKVSNCFKTIYTFAVTFLPSKCCLFRDPLFQSKQSLIFSKRCSPLALWKYFVHIYLLKLLRLKNAKTNKNSISRKNIIQWRITCVGFLNIDIQKSISWNILAPFFPSLILQRMATIFACLFFLHSATVCQLFATGLLSRVQILSAAKCSICTV